MVESELFGVDPALDAEVAKICKETERKASFLDFISKQKDDAIARARVYTELYDYVLNSTRNGDCPSHITAGEDYRK